MPELRRKEYAPLVVLEATANPKTGVALEIKKNNGFSEEGCNFSVVRKTVGRRLAIFVIEYDGKIIGGIAAPPNSCFTVEKDAFGPTGAFKALSKEKPTELHLYNPCVKLPTGAWW